MYGEDFYTEFSYISRNNDINGLNLMLETIDQKNLLMMYSAMFNNLKFIKHLVECDLDIHCEDNYVFKLSCGHNYAHITKYVISEANQPEYYINEAFVRYAQNGNIEFCKELLEIGADMTYNIHETMYFAYNDEMVNFLIENGEGIYDQFNHRSFEAI